MSENIKKLEDRVTKRYATYYMNKRVFDDFNAPADIYAECNDGLWIRKLITWVGGFRWSKWEKL